MAETDIYKLKLGSETYNLPFLPLSGGTMSGNIILGGGNAIIGSGNSIPSKFKDAAGINPEVHSLWLGAIGTGTNNTAGTEASGILFDGNTIKMWSPLDNSPLIIDSDNGAEHTLLHSGNITKDHVGLGNVDNTADANKSVNYATTAGSAPASDVYAWAKAANKPTYKFSEITEKIVASNEFNFLDKSYSQEYVWINYASQGTRDAITKNVAEFKFANGNSAGGFANLRAKGFIKNGKDDNDVLLAGGGSKALSDFLTSLPSHTHTKSEITDFPTSLPASDVYAWAKAASKPSYSHDEITAGNLTIGDGANSLFFRTNASWASGMYYHTTADEAMIFMNIGKNAAGTTNYTTSWIFAYGNPADRPAWNTLTPAMQIKGDSVVINKLLGSKVGASYNLDVNGSANATTLYQNGTQVSVVGHTHSASDVGAMPIITISRGTSTDFDANNMTDSAFYRPNGDVGSGGQYKSWNNFPTGVPAGGFGLLNFVEGGYRRQIYGGYYSNKLYTRYQYYSSGTVWSNWDSFAMSSELSSYLPKAGGDMSSGARISASGGNLMLGNSDNAGWVQIQDMCSQSGTDKWTIRQAGSATFASTVSAAGGFFESSDERIKDFGEDIQVDLQKLKNLKKKYFKFKGDNKLNLGVSAQEIQEIYPEIVMEDENGTLQVDYAKLSVIALKAIDVLQEDTDKRLKRIEALLNL